MGVRAGAAFESVAVEWMVAGNTGRWPLDRTDDVWTGKIGAFPDSGRYRFVASRRGSGVEVTTDWFPLPIAHWEAVRFISLAAANGWIGAAGERAVFSFSSSEENSLDWNLTEGSIQRGDADEVALGGWAASLHDGRLLLSRNGVEFLLGVEMCRADNELIAWRLSWRLEPDERIFGTGERFDALDQRGRTPDVRVYEEYKQQGARSYFPLPWLWSTGGYGIAIDGLSRVSYDLGALNPDEASVTIPTGASASGRWYLGTPKEMLWAYVRDAGLPAPMPIWAYGPWMSGNEWNSDARVREVVERTRAEGIPATVLVIEAWSDEVTFYLFNGTTHEAVDGEGAVPIESMEHDRRWPDPAGLVNWLHDQDVRVLLWQIPLLKDVAGHQQHDADLAYVDEAELGVRTVGGEPYRNRGWWFPGARAIDFTNPVARQWWFAKRAYLLDEVGVDGFKTDGGEHLWGREVRTFAGETGDQAANAYPTHYLKAYHSFLREHGHESPMTFSRAGFTGSQSFPAHWAGDEDSTWEAFRASLTAGLSAGASGIAFWGWDLAGFSGDLPSAELYKRATAMAAFSPIMQYHSEHNEHRRPLADRTPWNIVDHTGDPDVMEVYRFYARFRMNLVPYLLGLGTEAARTGLPLMRALALELPDDPEAAGIDDQFLLGADLMVAPILSSGVTERSVYLPEGDWRDLWSGEPVASGWMTAQTPSHIIPVFVRTGACIPLWMPDTVELGEEVGLPTAGSGQLVLMVFPGTSQCRLIDPVTLRPWTAELTFEEQVLKISTTDAPAATSVWIRSPITGSKVDQIVSLAAGTSTTKIDLRADAT